MIMAIYEVIDEEIPFNPNDSRTVLAQDVVRPLIIKSLVDSLLYPQSIESSSLHFASWVESPSECLGHALITHIAHDEDVPIPTIDSRFYTANRHSQTLADEVKQITLVSPDMSYNESVTNLSENFDKYDLEVMARMIGKSVLGHSATPAENMDRHVYHAIVGSGHVLDQLAEFFKDHCPATDEDLVLFDEWD